MGSWLAKPVHPVPLTNVPGSITNNTNNNKRTKPKPKPKPKPRPPNSPFYTGN